MKNGSTKMISVFLVTALLVLSLVGCGGSTAGKDTGSTTVAASAASSTQAPEATKETQKTKLKVMSWWDITKSDSLKQLKAKFEEKNPGIELEFIQIGSGYATKVLTIIAGGGNDVPDVMMLAADKLPKFASTGAVLPLDKYVTDQYKNSTYPLALNACTFDGKLYSVARDVTSMVMYLNTKMFADAKVDLPKEDWTVNDFLDIAKKLTKVENGKPTQWGYYFAKYEDTMYDWLLINGGDYASADGKKSMMGTPETKAGLQFMQDLIYKHKVTPTDAQAKQFGDEDSSPIVAGKVAMTIGGLSMSESFNNANPKVEYALRPLPTKDGKKVTHAFVNTWTIPKGAKNPDLSWKVLEFFSGKEGQQIVLDTHMGLPASKEVDTKTFLGQHPDHKYLMQSLEYAVPFRTLVYGADFYGLVGKELEMVWLNQKTVDQATAAIEAKAADILAGKKQ